MVGQTQARLNTTFGMKRSNIARKRSLSFSETGGGASILLCHLNSGIDDNYIFTFCRNMPVATYLKGIRPNSDPGLRRADIRKRIPVSSARHVTSAGRLKSVHRALQGIG